MAEITELNRMSDLSSNLPPATAEQPFAIACGISRHTIDSNGRFVIPSNFIKEFGNSFYMTIDESDRIVIFPADRFRDLGKALTYKRSDEYNNNDIAHAIDRIFAFAEIVNTDSSGRVQFTTTFRETLSEIKEVPSGTAVIVGALDRILVLTDEEFKDYRKEHLKSKGGIYNHGHLMRMTYATYEKQSDRAAAAGGAQR